MRVLSHLFARNQKWAKAISTQDPDFFTRLAQEQTPEYLWIGCADSRVSANQIIDLQPGELFVHRNVANMVIHTDLNCLSVMQYAVEVLKVKHIIVCGHYQCGGVRAALENKRLGLIDNWLRHLQDVIEKYDSRLTALPGLAERTNKLCELNVIEQVMNVCQTSIVQDAWSRDQSLFIHGWVYDLNDGRLRDLNICLTRPDEVKSIYQAALASLF